MMTDRSKTVRIIIAITAALAAVILSVAAANEYYPLILPPSYSHPAQKERIITDTDAGICIEQHGRSLKATCNRKEWELPKNNKVQDFLYEDVDHDDTKELMVLCWKRGRFGEHRPSWVKHDEIKWSQHIFIYEIKDDIVRPKWMASDIGVKAASWGFSDGKLYITDTDGGKTSWIWNSWGMEKL